MRDFVVVLDRTTVPAGDVTFDVTFDGFHNFVVYRTDLSPDELPLNAEGAVDPSAEGVELITYLAPGQSGTVSVSVDLESGSYVIVCTVVDHYGRGMRTGLQVSG